jgi:hypothetical protein
VGLVLHTGSRVEVYTVGRVEVYTVGRIGIKTGGFQGSLQENKYKASKWGNSEDILPHFWQPTNMLCQVKMSQGDSGKMCSGGAVQEQYLHHKL